MSTPGATVPSRTRSSDDFELVVLGPNMFRTSPLNSPGRLLIGRMSDCQICLEVDTLSRHHAQLHVEPGPRFLIEDLGSVNGVSVHGERIPPHTPTLVRPGVGIELGELTMLIRTRAEGTPARPVEVSGEADIPPRAWVVTEQMLQGRDPLLKTIANSQVTILITGETGVGKEHLAEQLREWSPRRQRPFVKLNCGGFPDALIESELFGHEAGAFTSALKLKRGQFELADSGTVFLDEIGDLSTTAQVKLLRFLETREFVRVGGEAPRRVDVRIMAATHRKLYGADAFRGFREDLYFRLAVVTLWLPPLRQRRDEIIPLAERFISRFCALEDKPAPVLSTAAQAELWAHAWPGNIRELRNVIEQAVVVCSTSTLEPQHLRLSQPRSASSALSLKTVTLPALRGRVDRSDCAEQGKGSRYRRSGAPPGSGDAAQVAGATRRQPEPGMQRSRRLTRDVHQVAGGREHRAAAQESSGWG